MQSEAVADEDGWLGFANEQCAQGSVARGNMFMPHSLRSGEIVPLCEPVLASEPLSPRCGCRPGSYEVDRSTPQGVLGQSQPRHRVRERQASSTTYSTTHTITIDVKTGKKVSRTKLGDVEHGETMSRAPFVVGNKVFVGNSGGKIGERGCLVALMSTRQAGPARLQHEQRPRALQRHAASPLARQRGSPTFHDRREMDLIFWDKFGTARPRKARKHQHRTIANPLISLIPNSRRQGHNATQNPPVEIP